MPVAEAGGVSKGRKVLCGMPVTEAGGVSKGRKALLGMPGMMPDAKGS